MNVLQVSGLTKAYRRSLRQLVEKESRSGIFNISFSIAKGEVFGLLGVEGSGKTTLIRTILGFTRPSSGTVTFLGKKSHRFLNTMLRKSGYMPEEYSFYEEFSGLQFLKFMSSGRKVDPSFTKGLTDALGLSGEVLREKVWQYSVVQQHKLVMVAAMQHNPPLLVLDEPTRQMSMPERQAFYRLVDRYTAQGGTVLLSTTNVVEAETLCDRIALLHGGKVLALETPESLGEKAIYNFAVHMEPAPDPDSLEGIGATPPQKGGRSHHFQAAGDINHLLQGLKKAGRVKTLDLERAALEHLLYRFYEKEDSDA